MSGVPASGEPRIGGAPALKSEGARSAKNRFLTDMVSISTRALRQIPREPDSVVPLLVVPLFFYVVNVAALGNIARLAVHLDFKAFELPAAILFAVTGVSRASTLVTDIQNGYFDRLCVTPVNRLALLLGLMVADFAIVVSLTLPVLVVGLGYGVVFVDGPAGAVVFILLAGCWGVAFTGFPYAIALKTGNPAAVNSSFVLFFPFTFLTTAFMPQSFLSGWLATVATYNPVTYLLAAMRSLTGSGGWDAMSLGEAFLAIGIVGVISMTLALLGLRGRVKGS